jgi:hypothetical protein
MSETGDDSNADEAKMKDVDSDAEKNKTSDVKETIKEVEPKEDSIKEELTKEEKKDDSKEINEDDLGDYIKADKFEGKKNG